MRTRNLPRNRESKSRSETPVRPDQTELERKKLARMKPWERIPIEKAREAETETIRRQNFFVTKGWLRQGEAL